MELVTGALTCRQIAAVIEAELPIGSIEEAVRAPCPDDDWDDTRIESRFHRLIEVFARLRGQVYQMVLQDRPEPNRWSWEDAIEIEPQPQDGPELVVVTCWPR